MPAQIPPEALSIGRARGRLSASSFTAFNRCEKQWFLNYRIGLRGPTNPHQVMGVIVEDALCGLLMERAGSEGNNWAQSEAPSSDCNTFEELKKWIFAKIPKSANKVFENGKSEFEKSLWSKGDWNESFTIEMVEKMLEHGIELQLEEVESCFEAGGGMHDFDVPAPCWKTPPHFALPGKVNQKIKWEDEPHIFSEQSLTWRDAWEIARPWVKDPRNPQPQRMYHPEKWAAGECDIVHRWDGGIRIIDVKMGDGGGKFAASLPDQLNFYSWLWNETHDSKCTGLEGWYLTNGMRKVVEITSKETSEYRAVHDLMQNYSADNKLPILEPCDGSAGGCHWCSKSEISYEPSKIEMPFESLSAIPNRVNVKGKLQGSWGPLPNHYGEMVLGAMIQYGDKMVTIEESQPGAFPMMHSAPAGEVIITGALPGVWRGQPRLYLDQHSEIVSNSDAELTRMGMLRTKANVTGVVLSCSRRDGTRMDGRPWSMMSFHIWDGERVAEAVAFGSAMNGSILAIKPGDTVSLISAELGWREGLVQLRIDSRSTRINVESKA